MVKFMSDLNVSTHSRLKAAGCIVSPSGIGKFGFNTQPPEGGWDKFMIDYFGQKLFQHTAA